MGPVWEKQLLIEPRLGDLKSANGVVVTYHGAVPVSWKLSVDGKTLDYKLVIPKGVHSTIHFPKLSDKSTLTMNGKVLMKEGIPKNTITTEGRWIVLKNVSGECAGTVSRN